MPGSRALPGWFSHFPFQWAAVLPASAGHSPHYPQSELLALASRDILQEPLNKAVNEEVSSLYPSGSHPSPKYPHLRASFFANPSLLQGWTQPAPMALSLLPGHLHREAWLCPTHLGTEPSTNSLLTPRACSTFFVLFSGMERTLSPGPEKWHPFPHYRWQAGSAEMVSGPRSGENWLLSEQPSWT